MSAHLELLQIIHALELKSHAPAVNPNPQAPSTDESRGGRRPPGGVDRDDDREPEFMLKSAEHYRRRLARCRTNRDVLLVLADAQRTLRAWTHTPVSAQPLPGTPFFRRWILDELGRGTSVTDIARLGGCSAQYVRRVRSEA